VEQYLTIKGVTWGLLGGWLGVGWGLLGGSEGLASPNPQGILINPTPNPLYTAEE